MRSYASTKGAKRENRSEVMASIDRDRLWRYRNSNSTENCIHGQKLMVDNTNNFIALTDGQTSYFIQLAKRTIHHIVESDGHNQALCGIHLRDPNAKILATKELYIEFICSRCLKAVKPELGKMETAT